MSAVAGRLPKPKLRGYFAESLNKAFLLAGVGSAISGVAYYFGCLVRHRNRRENFYATFDGDKEFERLRDLGFYKSVPPKDRSKALYDFGTMEDD